MVSPTRKDDTSRRRSPTHGSAAGEGSLKSDGSGKSGRNSKPDSDRDSVMRANTDEANSSTYAVPTISLTSADGRRSASAGRNSSTSTLTNIGHSLRRTVSPSKTVMEDPRKEERDRERSFSLGFKKKEDGPRGRLQFRSNSSSTVASLLGFAKFRKDKDDPPASQSGSASGSGSRSRTPTEEESDTDSAGSHKRGKSVGSQSMAQLGANNYSQWSQSLKHQGATSSGGSGSGSAGHGPGPASAGTPGSGSGSGTPNPFTRSSTGSASQLLDEDRPPAARRPSTPNPSSTYTSHSSNPSLMPPPSGFAKFRRKTASMLFSSDDEEPTRPPVFRSLSSQSIKIDKSDKGDKNSYDKHDKNDKNDKSGQGSTLTESTSTQSNTTSESGGSNRSETLSTVPSLPPATGAQFLNSPSILPSSPSLSFQDLPFSRPRSKTMPSSGAPVEKVLDSSKSASYSPRESVEDIQLPPANDRTAAEYMAAIKQLNMHGQTAALLASKDSEFHRQCMAIYTSEFDFTMDPIDMALRKFLMYVVLPKEAQQIDRILDAFATRYDECNPGIYADAELAYVVTFSLMILHTDSFNKSNKHKMQKSDYINNTFAEGVSPDILECFYDNITYTPFIHTEEEPDKKVLNTKKSSSFIRSDKNLIDPYALILEGKLDSIRPSLDNALGQDCPYSYAAPESREEFSSVRQAFINGPSLQLTSSRSRPGAFLSPDTTDNPLMADPGVIDIKIAKVGLLFRKEQKRVLSTARSVWREWGAILTASQLYLFKETQWVKSILKDLEAGHQVISANDQFHPTVTLSTTVMAALRNSSTSAPPKTSRKVPFVLSARSLGQEWVAAGSEADTAEWTHLINYAAAFSSHSINPNPAGAGTTVLQDIHTSRRLAMVDALHTLEEKVDGMEKDVDILLRNARHLKLMAPIQQRTRYHVNFCAARLSAKLDWQWLDFVKYQSYRAVLAKELEEEQEWQMEDGKEVKSLVGSVASRPTTATTEATTTAESSATAAEQPTAESTTASLASTSSAVLSGFPIKPDGFDDDHNESDSDSFISSLSPTHAISPVVQPETSPNFELDNEECGNFEGFEECLPAKADRNSFLLPPGGRASSPQRPGSALSSRSSLQPTISGTSNGSKQDRFYEVRESILRDTQQPDRSSSLDLPRTSSSSLSQSRSSGDLRSAEPSPLKPALSVRKLRTSLRNGSRSPKRETSPIRPEGLPHSLERSSSLLRGSDFTLHGKKFSVVEVNPEFAATPHHKRTVSRSERKDDLDEQQ